VLPDTVYKKFTSNITISKQALVSMMPDHKLVIINNQYLFDKIKGAMAGKLIKPLM
jgi:hypothetical protein